jgi:cobalamin synthase
MNGAQQIVVGRRHIGAMVALLLLVLATLLAGPIGFVLAAVFLLAWLVVTGSLHLALEILLLPFRAIGWLARR